MDKKDFAFFGAAIVIVIIVALIGKPLITGESISFLPSSEPSVDPNEPLPIPTDLPRNTPRPTETPVPTPTPVWNGEVKTVGYVDPSTYNIETPGHISMVPQPVSHRENREMTSYAIIQGEASGVTEVVDIPFGYWEMHITFDPWTDIPINSYLEFQIRNADDRSDYQVFNSVSEAPSSSKDFGDKDTWVIERYDGGSYYFVINEQLLKSYRIEIMVPKK